MEEKKESGWAWSSTIPEAELQNQVKNYSTLKITESYRGISVLVGLGMLGITLLTFIFGDAELDSGVVTELLLYAAALCYAYQGRRWALILLAVLWTGDKAIQVVDVVSSGQGSPVSLLFWWLVWLPYLLKAIKVENARRRMMQGATSNGGKFCPKCGVSQSADSKFCQACGSSTRV